MYMFQQDRGDGMNENGWNWVKEAMGLIFLRLGEIDKDGGIYEIYVIFHFWCPHCG